MKYKLFLIIFSFIFVIQLVFSSGITGIIKEEEKSPSQLFDINFEIDNSIISGIDELVSRASFESFGNVPTPVNLTYSILDSSGKLVYIGEEEIIVETQKVYEKSFRDLNFGTGNYILILKTEYNNGVEDEFWKKFEIQKKWTIGQLFDIKMELITPTVDDSRDFQVKVSFESFGNVSTPVHLKFNILDSSGNVVYSEEEFVIVETERSLLKSFNCLNLEEGDYVLVLDTLYNVDVKDEFKQPFRVNGTSDCCSLVVFLIILNVILFSIILYLLNEGKKNNGR